MPLDGSPRPTPIAWRRCRPALGTFVEVTIHDADSDETDLVEATDAAFGAVARVERLMSFHDPDSELSRLNAMAPSSGAPMRVDPWTFAVLSEARDLFIATDGVFDCSVGARLVECGLLPRHAELTEPDLNATFADVILDDGSVAFRKSLTIDLGGIAKGFAVDRAIDALRSCGVRSAVVDAGGDLRIFGAASRPIHLRGADGTLEFAGMLADGAVATSRPYDAERDGPRQSPGALVRSDRRTFVTDDRRYSVVAPTAMRADALTKVLAATGRDDHPCLPRLGAVAFIR